LANLARYVLQIDDANLLGDSERWVGGGSVKGKGILERLYRHMATGQVIPYNLDPLLPAGPPGQRIVYPIAALSYGGTCLDLAVLFSCVCLSKGLRPLIVLVPGHAACLVALDAPVNDSQPVDFGAWADQVQPGIWVKREVPTLGDWVIPIDPSCVCPPQRGGPWYRSELEGATQIALQSLLGDHVVVIDVVAVQGTGKVPYAPPIHPPTIYRHLPKRQGEWREFPSRRNLMNSLTQPTGRIVLQGQSGVGKSALALHFAAQADHGYGCFLEQCSTRDDLIGALAEQIARQHNLPPPGDMAGRLGYATQARETLEASSAPWVLVVDSANADPAVYAGRLPEPKPESGQALIVTTTNPTWQRWADDLDGLFLAVPPLEARDVDLAPSVGARAARLLGELPLLALPAVAWPTSQAVGASWTTIKADLERRAEVSSDGAQLLADMTIRHIPSAINVCGVMAWLPGIEIAPTELDQILNEGQVDPLASLCEIGVLSATEEADGSPSVTMHALLADRFRRLLTDRGFVRPSPVTREAISVDYSAAALCSATLYSRLPGSLAADLSKRCQSDITSSAVRAMLFTALEERGMTTAAAAEAARILDYLRQAKSDLYLDALLSEVRPVKDRGTDVAAIAAAVARLQGSMDSVMDAAARAESSELSPSESGRRRARPGQFKAMQALLERRAVDVEIEECLSANPRITRTELGDMYRSRVDAVLLELEKSRDERTSILHYDPANRQHDRALFNLAGTYILKSKLAYPEEVESIVQAAWETYAEVYRLRQALWSALPHLHKASCVAGMALAHYYRALLVPGLDPAERVTGLAAARDSALESLTERRAVEGLAGGDDTSKSLGLLMKIDAADRAVNIMDISQVRKVLDKASEEIRWELANADPPLLPLSRDEA
jgi:hypothetical protein